MRCVIGLRASPTERDQAPALALLYEAHWEELVRYVRRTFGRGPPDPEDVVQAAFAHFGALAEPHLVDNPRAFLYRSSKNFVIDQRRRALVHARSAQRDELMQMSECADDAKSRFAMRSWATFFGRFDTFARHNSSRASRRGFRLIALARGEYRRSREGRVNGRFFSLSA